MAPAAATAAAAAAALADAIAAPSVTSPRGVPAVAAVVAAAALSVGGAAVAVARAAVDASWGHGDLGARVPPPRDSPALLVWVQCGGFGLSMVGWEGAEWRESIESRVEQKSRAQESRTQDPP